MSIIFEKFTEKHIDEAVKLALAELENERKFCPDLPHADFSKHLVGILHWLSSQPFGKAAMSDGKLVGYLLFAGPWDGFFGDVKGVFSPLGASAFSYDYKNRGRLASMLFASVAEEFVEQDVFSCALSRYAHDEVIAKSFVLNGFGIRCSDFVREISEFDLQNNSCEVVFKELSVDKFTAVEHLQRGLHNHLAGAPVFFPSENFEDWFKNWIERETMRIFVAETDGRIIGFTVNHAFNSKERAEGYERSLPINIGHNVWIGGNVSILGGVTIGNESIIAAGSVVTKDIPSGVIAAGNPAKVLRKITDNDKIQNYT